MSIEFSLRKRATQSRRFAFLYLSLATLILVATYVSLPSIAGKTLQSVNQLEDATRAAVSPGEGTAAIAKASFVHLHVFGLVILILCLSTVSFASYLLARSAFIEIELAARFIGLADALCIAGNDFQQLERAAMLLVPRTKYFPELSEKNLKAFLDIVKGVRG